MRAGRKANRNTKGVILDAIVAVVRRNGDLKVENLMNCRCHARSLIRVGVNMIGLLGEKWLMILEIL